MTAPLGPRLATASIPLAPCGVSRVSRTLRYAVVFGEVVEGLGLVSRMEQQGSSSGHTRQRVFIADCGELQVKGATLAKVAQEQAERAHLLAGAGTEVDGDDESRRRAARFARQQEPAENQQQEAANDASRSAVSPPAAQQAAPKDAGHGDSQLAAENAGEVVDPLAGLTGKKRKLAELRAKMQEARKANDNAAVAEQRRLKTEGQQDGRKAYYREKAAAKSEQLKSMGLSDKDASRLESAWAAGNKRGKRSKEALPQGEAIFDQRSRFEAYMRRADQAALPADAYEANKAAEAEGRAYEVSEAAVDRMAGELKAVEERRAEFSRRRRFYGDKDVDYINDRNARFNKKIDRQFGQYTSEIRANLERGTALPDR